MDPSTTSNLFAVVGVALVVLGVGLLFGLAVALVVLGVAALAASYAFHTAAAAELRRKASA